MFYDYEKFKEVQTQINTAYPNVHWINYMQLTEQISDVNC